MVLARELLASFSRPSRTLILIDTLMMPFEDLRCKGVD
jgi:hypothetical protein